MKKLVAEYFFALEKFVDFGENTGSEKVAADFKERLGSKYDDEKFCKLLSCAGFIPDLYKSDSSEETLFSKLTEILVAEWAERMGFKSNVVKTKSSYEDINFSISEKIIVCDAKSFRLGRSQQAPNVKDFLKPADIQKWLNRHENGLGGLITFPDTHDWTESSDVYLYCTDKNCPTVILSYVHLALILHFCNKHSAKKLKQLWNYEKLFPKPLNRKISGGNRKAYWSVINSKIISVLDISESDFIIYFEQCKKLQTECIKSHIERLQEIKSQIVEEIENAYEKFSKEELLSELVEYRVKNETRKIDEFIKRIYKFRLGDNRE